MSSSATPWSTELDVAKAAARAAGEAIMGFYTDRSASRYVKNDGSVVTDADLAADRIIRSTILDAFPADALLTEEGADDRARLANDRVWVVDPIDGTNQFVEQTGEFDVYIALVVGHRPVVAVTYQPTTGMLLAAETGAGATVEVDGTAAPLRFVPVADDAAPRLMTSIWLGYPQNFPFVERLAARMAAPPPQVTHVGISIRRIMPAGQETDAVIGYLPGRPLDAQQFAWEWDFAAPDLIIHEAGGAMTDLRGNVHRYNKPKPVNDRGVLFSVDPRTNARIIDAFDLETSIER